MPNKFYNADYAENLRGIISKHISHIVNFGDQQVFENATTYTNMLFLSKNQKTDFTYIKIKDLKEVESTMSNFEDGKTNEKFTRGIIQNKSLSEKSWYFVVGENQIIFNKLKEVKTLLGDVAEKILVGLQTSADPIYILEFRKENPKTLTLFF